MIRGSMRECTPKVIESSWKANIHNRFDIEVRDARTNALKQKAQAFNVICDNLWKYMPYYFNYIAYSNGSGTPSPSDTTTFGTLYTSSSSEHELVTDIASGVSRRTRKAVLDEKTSVGVTITEVGLSNSKSSGYLCTHAMLQDMNGNPISITKTDTDIVTIYATVYVHWNPSGQNGIFLMPPANNGSFLDYISGSGFVSRNSYVAAGSSTYDSNRYASLGNGISYSLAWDKTTKTITSTMTRIPVDKGNVPGGFGWICSEGLIAIDVTDEYEVHSEPVGTGDGSTTEFSTKFDMPTNAVVYVDGVRMTSGVTVKPHPLCTDAFDYMCCIRDTLHDDKPCVCVGPGTIPPGGIQYVYNPLHDLGVKKFTCDNLIFALSDDFKNWSQDYSSKAIIPEEHRHCKYIRITSTLPTTGATYRPYWVVADFPEDITPKNIVFDEPPAEGSVITIDYVTPFVPKDANHVYDLSMTIQLGEYAES